MKTKMDNAKIAAPIVINRAKAQMKALQDTNKAKMDSYNEVTESEADAYKVMMADLKYSKTTDRDILDYIKVKAIGNFN